MTFQIEAWSADGKRVVRLDGPVSNLALVYDAFIHGGFIHGREWSTEEVERLVGMAEMGATIREMATCCERTEGAIRIRLDRLGIKATNKKRLRFSDRAFRSWVAAAGPGARLEYYIGNITNDAKAQRLRETAADKERKGKVRLFQVRDKPRAHPEGTFNYVYIAEKV